MLARSGQAEKALEHYKLALEYNPASASAHHNAASICQRLNRFDEAITHYQAALAAKPRLVESASNLAVAQLNAKRPADAVQTCRRAIRLQSEVHGTMNLEASHHLNVGLRLLGRRSEAVEETWARIEELIATRSKDSAAAPRPFVRPAPVVLPLTRSVTIPRHAAHSSAAALTVVCVKWGTLYGAEYVNRLSRGARRALGAGGVKAFVCFTEDGSGLDADIEVRPLPERAWKGWWYKAHLFSRAAALSGRILYLDLDTVIVGDMAALRTYDGPFATLSTAGFDAEEGFADGYNTSAMLWEASAEGEAHPHAHPLCALHDALRAEVFECLMRWDHWVEMIVPSAHLLQELHPAMFVDYRTHCRGQPAPPADASVVCFPRNPKPHEAPEEWITESWKNGWS